MWHIPPIAFNLQDSNTDDNKDNNSDDDDNSDDNEDQWRSWVLCDGGDL